MPSTWKNHLNLTKPLIQKIKKSSSWNTCKDRATTTTTGRHLHASWHIYILLYFTIPLPYEQISSAPLMSRPPFNWIFFWAQSGLVKQRNLKKITLILWHSTMMFTNRARGVLLVSSATIVTAVGHSCISLKITCSAAFSPTHPSKFPHSRGKRGMKLGRKTSDERTGCRLVSYPESRDTIMMQGRCASSEVDTLHHRHRHHHFKKKSHYLIYWRWENDVAGVRKITDFRNLWLLHVLA